MSNDRFRKMAEKLRVDAESKLAPRETHTHKKLAQARHAERDGLKFRRAADLIDAYCNAVQMPPALIGAKLTKDSFLSAAALKGKHVANGFHEYMVDTNEPSCDDPVSVALRSLAETAKTPEQIAAEEAEAKRLEIARAIDGLRHCDIPGFFPTPDSVIDLMLEEADIEPFNQVLEPSAGIGSILDRIRNRVSAVFLEAVEVNPSLVSILEMKEHQVSHCDFLQCVGGKYDRIIMNPPFEKLQAVKHVEHAYNLLKPGGRIVAIMPPNHVEKLSMDYEVTELPERSFANADAFRRTAVSVVMVTIDKPGVPSKPSAFDQIRKTGVMFVGGS